MLFYHRNGHRYALRTDGFVSINTPYNGGEMTTRPIIFSGQMLEINFSTSATGSIRIEVQGTDGVPCPGFTLEENEAIVGDKISHIVSWKSGANLASLSGRPVRLRFVMLDADLYSICFNR